MLFAARNREAGVSTKDLAEIIYENLVGRLADSPPTLKQGLCCSK